MTPETPEIPRYDIGWQEMVEEPDGRYMRYEDYAALEAENAELKASRTRARESFGHRDADGNCLCVICTKDLDGIENLSFEHEMEKFAAVKRAEALEAERDALREAIGEWDAAWRRLYGGVTTSNVLDYDHEAFRAELGAKEAALRAFLAPQEPTNKETQVTEDFTSLSTTTGILLRDYFAGQALHEAAGAICDDLAEKGDAGAVEHAARHAKAAYLLADAMLAEGEREQ